MPELFETEDIRSRIAQGYGVEIDPFAAALIATAMEDSLDKPCLGCDGHAEHLTVLLLPPVLFGGRITIPDGASEAVAVVPLCRRCYNRGRRDARYHRRIVTSAIEELIKNALLESIP